MVLFTTRRGAFKAANCNSWIEDLIAYVLIREWMHAPTLIIDNAPARARMEEIVTEHENVQRMRLAPYSYLLNPIELVWSSFKSHVKRSLRKRMTEQSEMQRAGGITINEQRMRHLEQLAGEAIGNITARMCANVANQVEKYYPSVMRQEDLKEQQTIEAQKCSKTSYFHC